MSKITIVDADNKFLLTSFGKGIYMRLWADYTNKEYYKDYTYDNSYKRIILAGKMASGKDYLRNKLVEQGFKKDISYTSRPIRENEVEGNDYYFITTNKFQEMIKNQEFFEYTEFCGWYYGTTREAWDSCNVFIMNPYGLNHLKDKDKKQSLILYLDVPLDIRLKRLEKRVMGYDNIERRISTDFHDFIGLPYTYKLKDLKITKLNFPGDWDK